MSAFLSCNETDNHRAAPGAPRKPAVYAQMEGRIHAIALFPEAVAAAPGAPMKPRLSTKPSITDRNTIRRNLFHRGVPTTKKCPKTPKKPFVRIIVDRTTVSPPRRLVREFAPAEACCPGAPRKPMGFAPTVDCDEMKPCFLFDI